MFIARLITLNIATAIAYFLVAQWLLSFALPPIDAVPIWVSAGIAAGTILLWGYALLPGIFLGAFAVGLGLESTSLSPFSLALLVGSQAALHAFLIRFLLAFSSRWPSPLVEDIDITSFFLIGGLVAGLPSAVLTIAVQTWVGQLPINVAFVQFLMWLTGGALGVILFTPVMLIMFAEPRDIWRPRLKSVGVPLLLMLFALILVVHQILQQYHQVKNQRFASNVAVTHALLAYELDSYHALLKSMRAYFSHSDFVSETEFAAYLNDVGNVHQTIHAAMWIEANPLANEPFYLRYLEVFDPKNKTYSTLSPREICRLPSDHARCVQVMSATHEPFVYPVFESLKSIFPNKFMLAESVQSGMGGYNGIVIYIFDYTALFNRLSLSPAQQWVALKVTDSLNQTVLFQSDHFSTLSLPYTRSHELILSDSVQWQIEYQPTTAFFVDNQMQSLQILIFVGVMLSLVVGIWLFSSNGRVSQIKQAVREKTWALEKHMTLLSLSETKYRQLIENIKDEYILYSHDVQGNITYISPSVTNILGYSSKEMSGRYSKYMPDTELNRLVDKLTEETYSGKAMTYDVEMVDKQGQLHVMTVREMPSFDEKGNLLGVDGILRDITEQRAASLALEKLSLAVQHSPNAIIITNRHREIEYVNPKFTMMTGYAEHEAKGRWPSLIRPAAEKEKMNAALWETVLTGQEWRADIPNFKKSGEIYWAQELIAPMLDASGDVSHVVITQVDITESRRLNEETIYQASHDLLTGLINRREFDSRLKRVIDSARIDQSEHALCFMDLDQFKVINDTCGHIAGDELLRQVGRLLQAHIRVRDTIARLGGDEFVILMEHCSIDQAYNACQDVISLFEDFRFHWEGYSFTIGVSIGLTVIDAHTKDHIEAMRNVDNACYAAKDSGRNQVEVHTEDSERLLQRRGEIQWSTEISEALDEDRFVLFAQPIKSISQVDAKLSYEILLRLRRRDGSLSPPGTFLPAAERYNSVGRIDRWVVSKTLDWLDRHVEQLTHIASISINLSGVTLSEPSVLNFVRERLHTAIFPTEKIKFEITETAAIANLSAATEFIESLKSMGIGFSLDDFGSGLSSFAYLKNMQVDALKIDGMFVKDMLTDPLDYEMVKSINEIGHVMGLETIAEFVETPEILSKLQEIGVDHAQGYAIGRPEPIESMLVKRAA